MNNPRAPSGKRVYKRVMGRYGWTSEHRHIMEQHLGRALATEEHVFHINGDWMDNRIENLMIIPKMFKNKRSADYRKLVDRINEALYDLVGSPIFTFLKDVIPLLELWGIQQDDWTEHQVGRDKENVITVKLLKTIYLLSKISHYHVAKLVNLKTRFPRLFEKMEDMAKENKEILELQDVNDLKKSEILTMQNLIKALNDVNF